MPDDQVLAAGRGVAVEGLVDLAVGRVDADLQHLHQHATPIGDPAHMGMRLVGQLRDGNLSQMHAVRLAGQYGYGFHRPPPWPSPDRLVGKDEKRNVCGNRVSTSGAAARLVARPWFRCI